MSRSAGIGYQLFARQTVMEELIVHMRRAFLEVVRVHYWRQIESGKLPRKSTAARLLLNSIDSGMETIHTPGLQDWDFLVQYHGKGVFEKAADLHLHDVEESRALRAESNGDQVLHRDEEAAGAEGSFTIQPFSAPGEVKSDESPARSYLDASLPADSFGGGYIAAPAAEWLGRVPGQPPLHSTRPRQASAPSAGGAARAARNRANSVQSRISATGRVARSASFMSIDEYDAASEEAHRRNPQPSSICKRMFTAPAQWIRNALNEYLVAELVYVLTSFIEAHEYAQRTIPFYLGETESIDTPEESIVVEESKGLVKKAREKLATIDESIVIKQVSKQTARWVLHIQEDMIQSFLKEGILTQADVEAMLEEVQVDLSGLGKVEWLSMLMSQLQYKLSEVIADKVFNLSKTCCCGRLGDRTDDVPVSRDGECHDDDGRAGGDAEEGNIEMNVRSADNIDATLSPIPEGDNEGMNE